MGLAAVVTSTQEEYLTPTRSLQGLQVVQDGAIHIRKVRRNVFQKCFIEMQFAKFNTSSTTFNQLSVRFVPFLACVLLVTVINQL